MRIIVCDDEKDWLEQAVHTLKRYADQSGMHLEVSSCPDADSLFSEIRDPADLIFMDIVFGEKEEDGILLTRRINETCPGCQVVYLTNYLFYATEVYETEHIWFLLKEQFEEKLPKVIEKFQKLRRGRNARFVFQTSRGHTVSLPFDEILYLERSARITNVVVDKETFQTTSRIIQLMEMLPEIDFLRCHNSIIVNLNAVREIKGDELLMKNGKTLLISRAYRQRFRKGFLKWAESHLAP